MNFQKLPVLVNNNIHVIVETTKGSSVKYGYDSKVEAMEVRHILTNGSAFPFNFGFIPLTVAEDGDPLDVIIVSDLPFTMGVLVKCRVIGAFLAKQEKDGELIRNDRIVAVPVADKTLDYITAMEDLNESYLKKIENFFVSYNKARNVKFIPTIRLESSKAMQLINKHVKEVFYL
ncbi:MAG TPA: inorganic diphosphatase [Cyclobacteriaceae bacterium]